MPNLARALVVGTMAAGALLPMVPAEGLAAYFLIAFPPFGIIMIAFLVPFYWVLAQAVVRSSIDSSDGFSRHRSTPWFSRPSPGTSGAAWWRWSPRPWSTTPSGPLRPI